MDEFSRIVIEQYCLKNRNTQKAKKLLRLVRLSYDPGAIGTDTDALYLENVINREKDQEFKTALQELDDYLFG